MKSFNLLFLILLFGSVLNGQSTVEPDFILIGRDALPQNGEIVTDTFFFFDQTKGALRGGVLSNSTNWSPDSIQNYSISWGQNAKASGEYGSVSIGNETIASGDYGSASIGYYTKALSNYGSTALGYYS